MHLLFDGRGGVGGWQLQKKTPLFLGDGGRGGGGGGAVIVGILAATINVFRPIDSMGIDSGISRNAPQTTVTVAATVALQCCASRQHLLRLVHHFGYRRAR